MCFGSVSTKPNVAVLPFATFVQNVAVLLAGHLLPYNSCRNLSMELVYISQISACKM